MLSNNMSFVLPCPNCGPRDVVEFRYGGQILTDSSTGKNLPEVQTERWYHRYGCRRWLQARRDVTNNTVLETSWLGEEAP
jgi:sarcosine oxidase, subunit delta